MFEFNFTTREEYLQQKKVWFFVYKNQVKKIQKCKIAMKEAMRKEGRITWTEISALKEAHAEMEKLLAIRAESRREAGRQYQASKLVKA